jgi:hypothetical protein
MFGKRLRTLSPFVWLLITCAGALGCGSSKTVAVNNATGGPTYTLIIDDSLNWCNITVTPPGTSDVVNTETLTGIAAGTVVQLSVKPDSGFTWPGSWKGTDDDASTAETNKVTMNADKTVTVCCPTSVGGSCSY